MANKLPPDPDDEGAFDRMMSDPVSAAPLEELCRPLSARVLPRSALLTADGSPITPVRAAGMLKRKRKA